MDKSLSHLNFFIEHIPKTLVYYDGKEINSGQQFSLGLLDRLLNASYSLRLIFENIVKVSELEFSAGITIRTIILDMLLGLEFYKFLKDNLAQKTSKTELRDLADDFCNKQLADGLDHTAKYLKIKKTLGYIDDIKLKEVYNNFASIHKSLLKPHLGDGTMPEVKYPKASTPSGLFKKLGSDSDMKKIAGIYDLYLFYSKYDHFGILYFEAINTSIDEKISQLNIAVSLFVNHCANLFDILERTSNKDQFLFNQYKIADDYLLKMNTV